MRTLEIEVKGPGSGRESALRALQTVGFAVTYPRARASMNAPWISWMSESVTGLDIRFPERQMSSET